MKLFELLQGIDDYSITGDKDIEITNIAYDSRKVREGSLFICIKGFVSDGHDYAMQAINAKASAIIAEKDIDLPGVVKVYVHDSRKALAVVSANFFGKPSDKLTMIGVTGTKGKTTVTFMTDAIFNTAGRKSGLIGTIINKIGSETVYASRTTPESYELWSMLDRCVKEGADSCIMEVSSQGLWLDRVYGIEFKTGVFTNLYNDHIGPNEHKNMQEYINAKSILFQRSENGVINADAEYSEVMTETLKKNPKASLYTYGIDNEAMVRASDIRPVSDKQRIGTEFTLESPWYKGKIFVGMPGRFNVYNALAAICCAGIEGIEFKHVCSGLSSVTVKGRVQPVVTGSDYQVIVDYAHNAASLENLLSTLREHAQRRLICVFGCGGDRAKSRRFEMGEVSGNMADITVITSDNPRTESPDDILSDIESGILKTSGEYVKITDRTDAIRYALQIAQKGDIIVIAGKGHETYQIFADKTIHYDDVEVAYSLIEEINSHK